MTLAQPPAAISRRLHYAMLLGCAAFLFQSISYSFVDIDLWHQMALIRESLSAHHLLTADPYAYTPTLHPITDHEWGAGAVAYFAARWFGGRAILLLKFLLAFATAFAGLRCARLRNSDSCLLALCAPIAIFLAHLGFLAAIRAQDYSFCLTALWLLLLERDRAGNRLWTIAALCIFPLWLNLHAGFVVAIAVTAFHALEQALRRQPFFHLFPLLAAMVLEIFLNPYGLEYFRFLRRALFMNRPFSAEWGPVSDLGFTFTATFATAFLIAVYAAVSAGWRRAPGIFILAATAFQAALHRKLLPLFAIAWFCYVPAYLESTPPGQWWIAFCRRKSSFLSVAWTAFTFICLFAAFRSQPWRLNVPSFLYPVGAVHYLDQRHFSGNLMTPFRTGAYVSWNLYPAVKVSLDSRYEVAYPNSVVQTASAFYQAQTNWQSTLQDSLSDAVLVPLNTPVAPLMPSTGWPRVYADPSFQIYARPGSALPPDDRISSPVNGVFSVPPL
jgi:hypothetical protein